MDKAEATEVAEARLGELRCLPYERLVREWLRQPRSEYATAPSGRRYNLEVEAFRDGRPSQDLRVRVAVDDGGLSLVHPLVRDFIMAPNGTLVGEQAREL